MSILRLRLHLRKKNITSPCIHFELLWDCGDSHKYSGDNLIGFFFFDDLLLLKTTLWITTFQTLLKSIFSWVCFLPFAGKHRSRTVQNPFFIDVYCEPKAATSSCVHFKVAASPTKKKNITSSYIHFEPLWDCGDNQPKCSGGNLIGLLCLNYRWFSKTPQMRDIIFWLKKQQFWLSLVYI